jgi:hypothetical protein
MFFGLSLPVAIFADESILILLVHFMLLRYFKQKIAYSKSLTKAIFYRSHQHSVIHTQLIDNNTLPTIITLVAYSNIHYARIYGLLQNVVNIFRKGFTLIHFYRSKTMKHN